ncbi:MAG: hypothetical protein LH465_03035 [Sphingomonas bacterium]|nr:hypothetical protein [Sphingomonas bacterium]
MSLDRAELAGTGAALAFHVALVAALSLSLAQVDRVPEPPSMEVELIDEVGLTAAAPAALVAPAPASEAPEIGVAEPIDPVPAPRIEPSSAPPMITPTPRVTNQPAAKSAAVRTAPARPAPRASRIGDDFLKGIDEAPARAASAKPAAATVSASAMAGIVSAIRRQVQPCADRQVSPGPGASRIRVRMRLQLLPNGRLRRSPQVIGTSGVDDENGRYEERVKDLAVATFVGCAPLAGLPPELYETASGKGWSDFIMNYNLP